LSFLRCDLLLPFLWKKFYGRGLLFNIRAFVPSKPF
jgi:hypothetical protein